MRKARKTDPVLVNLGVVEDALHDSDIKIAGSKLNRKMLIEALPKALGDGCAIDERHAFQKIIAHAIGEVLGAEVHQWTAKVAAVQAELDELNAGKAGKDAVLAEKQAQLDAKKAELKEKKDGHREDGDARKAAEHFLSDSTSAVQNFDDNMVEKDNEKKVYEAGVSETLASLKKAEYENAKAKKQAEGKGLEHLRFLLTGAGGDDSLLLCFPAALMKKPEDRGEFDNTVIVEVEKRLNNFITTAANELAEGPAGKERAEATAKDAEIKRDAAIAKQEASGDSARHAEEEKNGIDTEVKAATQEVKESAKVQEAKIKALSKEQASLDEATRNNEALTFLVERVSTPEPEPDLEVADAPMEAEADAAEA